MTQTITKIERFDTIEQLVMACAIENIEIQGVENDLESELKFVRKSLVQAKGRQDMIILYGVDSKAYAIKNFGYVAMA